MLWTGCFCCTDICAQIMASLVPIRHWFFKLNSCLFLLLKVFCVFVGVLCSFMLSEALYTVVLMWFVACLWTSGKLRVNELVRGQHVYVCIVMYTFTRVWIYPSPGRSGAAGFELNFCECECFYSHSNLSCERFMWLCCCADVFQTSFYTMRVLYVSVTRYSRYIRVMVCACMFISTKNHLRRKYFIL